MPTKGFGGFVGSLQARIFFKESFGLGQHLEFFSADFLGYRRRWRLKARRRGSEAGQNGFMFREDAAGAFEGGCIHELLAMALSSDGLPGFNFSAQHGQVLGRVAGRWRWPGSKGVPPVPEGRRRVQPQGL